MYMEMYYYVCIVPTTMYKIHFKVEGEYTK